MRPDEIISLGEQQLQDEKYAEAASTFTKAMQAGADPKQTLPRRAWAYLKAGEYDLAASGFTDAIELDPGNAHLYSERGVSRLNQGSYALALLDLDQALEMEPENPYRHSSRGYLRHHLGDLDGAHLDYTRALELDPDDEITRNNLELLEEKMKYSKPGTQQYPVPKPEASAVAGQSTDPGIQDYLREIARVFTSREGFSDFMRFLSGRKNG